MSDRQRLTLSLIILLSAFLFNQHFSTIVNYTSDRVGTAEPALNQDSLLRAYISMFTHNAKVEILGRKQTIDTINQCVYYEFEDGSRDTLCVTDTTMTPIDYLVPIDLYLSPEKLVQ